MGQGQTGNVTLLGRYSGTIQVASAQVLQCKSRTRDFTPKIASLVSQKWACLLALHSPFHRHGDIPTIAVAAFVQIETVHTHNQTTDARWKEYCSTKTVNNSRTRTKSIENSRQRGAREIVQCLDSLSTDIKGTQGNGRARLAHRTSTHTRIPQRGGLTSHSPCSCS